MDVLVKQGSIVQQDADAIIVNLFEGATQPTGAAGAVDQALGGAISEMIAQGDLTGKAGEVGVLYPRKAIPAKRVLVAGLGKAEKLDLEAIRQAAAAAIQKARSLNARSVATIVHGAGSGGMDVREAALATIEGSLLAMYRFAAQKAEEDKKEVESLTVVESDAGKLAQIEAAAQLAQELASGVFLTRDLVNLPPNQATPTRMAQVAAGMAEEYRFELIIGDREWARVHNMGAYLAVAKGAGEEPKFIVLEYNPGRKDLDTIVLVGKGITFDSGGVSLKPAEGMGEMKSDMGGAAAVLGAMKVIGQIKPSLRVIAITPCTENMPDASAYHPADIITASNGKTIEIISTDAEGRLILADALVYARQYQPKAVVDLATLTGSCIIALGEGIAGGLFASDPAAKRAIGQQRAEDARAPVALAAVGRLQESDRDACRRPEKFGRQI